MSDSSHVLLDLLRELGEEAAEAVESQECCQGFGW